MQHGNLFAVAGTPFAENEMAAQSKAFQRRQFPVQHRGLKARRFFAAHRHRTEPPRRFLKKIFWFVHLRFGPENMSPTGLVVVAGKILTLFFFPPNPIFQTN